MRSADLGVQCEAFARLDEFPDDAAPLLDDRSGLFESRTWWETVVDTALPPDAIPCFLLIRLGGRPAAVFPLLRYRRGAEPDGVVLGSLTTPYSCLFAPLLAQGLDTAGTEAALRGFARFCRGGAVTRLDAMAADWIGWPLLTAAARASGLAPLRFAHFGNWHESVGPGGWACYLAQRPGALRETIRRRLRRSEALPDARFTLLRRPAETAGGVAAYESVYARSWKDPEPFPRFTPGLIRACAASGTLRLGLWWVGNVPVAAQLWVVERNRATMVKLAHDEAFKAHSPGTVLTAHMLRHLLDREAVTEIDFGRGDDAYKQGWARARRQRDGVLLANPARPAGAVAILRHTLGGVRRRLRS